MSAKTQTTREARDNILNGVNVSGLVDTIRAVRQRPELADFIFRAANTWVDGGHCRTRVDGFYGTCEEIPHKKPYEFDADEPPTLLGEDRGANPVEYVLTALSSCMTTALVYHAAAQGIELEAVDSELEGDIDMHGFLDLDPNVRKGYKEIRVKFRVKSAADKAKLTELVKKSPVYDVISNGTQVNISVEKR